jgi:hypothetical protein
MSRRLDLDPPLLDGDTGERILTGSVSPADAPPGYAGVTRVLEAAARPPEPAERAGEVEAVARFAAAVREAGDAAPAPAQTRRPRALRPRIAVAALAGSLTLTTGLAAAGALPGPAQTVAATVLDTVGIEVPSPAPETPAPPVVEAPVKVTTTTGPAPPTTRTSPKAVRAPVPASVPAPVPASEPEGKTATEQSEGELKPSAKQDRNDQRDGPRAEKASAQRHTDKASARAEKAQQRGDRSDANQKGRRDKGH